MDIAIGAPGVVGMVVSGLVGLGALIGGLRLRHEVGTVVVARVSREDASPEGAEDPLLFIAAPGVEPTAEQRAAVVAAALEREYQVVDVLPDGLHGEVALMAMEERAEDKPLATGSSAGVLIAVRRSVWRRAELGEVPEHLERLELATLFRELRKFACRNTGLVFLPELRVSPLDWRARERFLAYHDAVPDRLISANLLLTLVLLACASVAPLWAAGALALFHLQPLIALLGAPIRPAGLVSIALSRSLGVWVGALRDWKLFRESPRRAETDALRESYAELVAEGTGRFFEPARTTCPMCDDERIAKRVVCRDYVNSKPGRFKLDQCRGCGHTFQNPRLNLEGLSYYYRDVYDGWGKHEAETNFALEAEQERYRRFLSLPKGSANPSLWLDVGGGYGHMCNLAGPVWPETTFHLLDMSDSAREAVRRRWVEQAFCGLFQDLAGALEDRYDLVSMSHYLEHTLDPIGELGAAATVLRDGGFLLVEVPNPSSLMATLCGRYWLPWIQPQHLHMIGSDAMARYLDEAGFEPVVWEHYRADTPLPVTLAFSMFLSGWLPAKETPWRKRWSWGSWFTVRLVWALSMVFFAMTLMIDVVVTIAKKVTNAGGSYRVLARRTVRDAV